MFSMVDMKISNLQSVREAFRRVGVRVSMAERPEDIEKADTLILPGVGAFGDGIRNLREQGLVEPILKHAREAQKPLLGICLGMQLLADESEEFGLHGGLGLVPGRVTRLEPNDPGLRVPNIGWCDVSVANPHGRLFSAPSESGLTFYFAHSFRFVCESADDVAAVIDYGGAVTAAIECGNIFGIQFHPERSQSAGLDLLEAFCKLVKEDF